MALIELMGASVNPKKWVRPAAFFVLFTCWCPDFFIFGNPAGFGKGVSSAFKLSNFRTPVVKCDEMVYSSLSIGVDGRGGKDVELDSVSGVLHCSGECVLLLKTNVQKRAKQVDATFYSTQSPGIYNPGMPLYSGWTMIGLNSH